MIGARSLFPKVNLAVINAGTATTVDGVDMTGNFLGGVIAPGVDLMRSSLAQAAARLPLARGESVAHPDNTDDAIRTGITDAIVGLVEQRMRRIRERAGSPVQVVLSGGNRGVLQPVLEAHGKFGPLALEPELVLRGVWHRARAIASGEIANTSISGAHA
jgi:type III pantothenate kinase